jgi:hypothetical protein
MQWEAAAPLNEQARWVASLLSLQDSLKPVGASADPFDFGRPGAWRRLQQRVQGKIPMDVVVFEDRTVMDLMASAASVTETQLVIDWPAVWSHGFHPGRMSVSLLRGRNLEEICNRYLEDYSLELIPLDNRTVLLSTDAVRRGIERVITVRLDQGMNEDDLRVALRSVVPRGPDQKSRFRMQAVPGEEKLLMLRICLPTLAQLRDAELRKALGIVE